MIIVSVSMMTGKKMFTSRTMTYDPYRRFSESALVMCLVNLCTVLPSTWVWKSFTFVS